MADRRVHARHHNGDEIVRYDRAGKWYLEPRRGVRRRLSVADAARIAASSNCWRWSAGVPGGRRFDAEVVRFQLWRAG